MRAAAVYERFKTDFGTKWLTFSIETYPWCLLVRGALAMGDREFAETTYGTQTFSGLIGNGNLVASQFHQEKSGEVGLAMLKNFCEWKV